MSPTRFILVLFVLIVSQTNAHREIKANVYNLKELLNSQDWTYTEVPPIHTNSYKVNVLNWCILLQHKAMVHPTPKETILYTGKPDVYFIPQVTVSEESIRQRKHPQQVTTYWSSEQISVFVYIPGIQEGSTWDLEHQNDWKPRTIALSENEQNIKHITVHSGVYDAINTKAFYKSFLMAIWDLKRYGNRLTLSGHGFGGAVASLIPILLLGDVDCAFVNYILRQTTPYVRDSDSLKTTKKKTRQLFKRIQVITFGAFGFIGHRDSEMVGHRWHPVRRGDVSVDFLNIIRATDVYPMMFNGHSTNVPEQPFRTDDVLQNVDYAYYGPIGDYVVILQTDDKHVPYRLVELDTMELFEKHLIFGAQTFKEVATKNDMKDIWDIVKRENAYETYRREIDEAVEMYSYSIRFKEPLKKRQAVLIVMVGIGCVVTVICCCFVFGTFIGYFVTKYGILIKVQRKKEMRV